MIQVLSQIEAFLHWFEKYSFGLRTESSDKMTHHFIAFQLFITISTFLVRKKCNTLKSLTKLFPDVR